MKQGILLRFVVQRGLFNWACSIAQYGSGYTHCDVVTLDGKYLGAHLIGGVQELLPGYDKGKFSKETFVHLRAAEWQVEAFFSFLRDQLGKPYDPVSILFFFGFFSDRNWQDPNAWTCSELVASALIACGILPEDMVLPTGRITPRDLLWMTDVLTKVSGGDGNA